MFKVFFSLIIKTLKISKAAYVKVFEFEEDSKRNVAK